MTKCETFTTIGLPPSLNSFRACLSQPLGELALGSLKQHMDCARRALKVLGNVIDRDIIQHELDGLALSVRQSKNRYTQPMLALCLFELLLDTRS